MFELAFKAKLPFIGIRTDDPVNVREVLHVLSQKELKQMPATQNAVFVSDTYLYWTDDMKTVTTDNYRKLTNATSSCVVINGEPSPLIFDAGVLPTPDCFHRDFLQKFVAKEKISSVVQVLKGLSPKAAQQVSMLTMARTGSILPNEVRKTRQMLSGIHPGLESLDTDYDFYEWPTEVREWLDLNKYYFLDPNTTAKLVPRGLMLRGFRGVGKTSASFAIAKELDVPLFRLDISANLTRWLGEAESRIAHNLHVIEQNAPCVFLLDETEKLFTGGEEGTLPRIMAQLLWWTQYHRSRVITLMTTNDFTKIPPELYRPGRVDRVIEIQKLKLSDAKLFAAKVYKSVLGEMPPLSRQKIIREAIDKLEQSSIAHADVTVLVYDLIKTKKWTLEGSGD